MANFRYVTPNALRARVVRQRQRVLTAGLPVLLGGFFIHPLVSLTAGVMALSFWNRGTQHLHGAIGEERALGSPVVHPGSLAELPAHFIVFNNIVVPTEDGGTRELDLVVLGRNGLFVIDAKHLRGEISGAESDREWRQVKRARHSGRSYANPVRNPVAQVRSAAGVLHRHLMSRGIKIWVQGLVVFTHPKATLEVEAPSLPVVTLDALAQTIEGFPANRPPRQFLEILQILKSLRTGVPAEQDAGPRHVSVFMRDFVTAQERLSGLSLRQRWTLKRVKRSLVRVPSLPTPAPAPEPETGSVNSPARTQQTLPLVGEITLIQRVTTVLRRRDTAR